MKHILLIAIFLSLTAHSEERYTEDQLIGLLSKSSMQNANADFDKTYRESNNFKFSFPKSNLSNLEKEAQINAVLDYISQQPKSDKGVAAIEQFRNYQPKAMRQHHDMNIYVPVFNIPSRVVGIENIWISKDVENQSIDLLNNRSATTLKFIDDIYSSGHLGQITGIQLSLKEVDRQTLSYWSKLLIAEMGLSQPQQFFAADLALQALDKELTKHLLKQSNLRVKEKLIRKLNHFDEAFAINQLLDSIDDSEVSKFSISMLKPYINRHEEVKNALFNRFKNGKNINSIAFAFSELSNPSDIKHLQSIYWLSPSKNIQKAIERSLKMNSHPYAKTAFSEISLGEMK